MTTVTLWRRQLNRLHAAGVIGDDDLVIVRRWDSASAEYRVGLPVLERMADYYRAAIAAGSLNKWETRDGQRLICKWEIEQP